MTGPRPTNKKRIKLVEERINENPDPQPVTHGVCSGDRRAGERMRRTPSRQDDVKAASNSRVSNTPQRNITDFTDGLRCMDETFRATTRATSA